VDGPLPRARARERRPLHGRRHRQSRGAGPLLHRRGARQHRPARGRGGLGRRRRHGRVPLVRRPGPRRRLAGAAPHPPPGPVPPDVRHPRRRDVLRRGPDAAQRPADGHREVRGPAGAARVRLLRDPARPDARKARLGGQSAGLRRPLHPEGRGGQRAGLHEPQPVHPRGEERGGGRDHRLSLHEPLRTDVRKWLKQGIGVHHAGLLPKYRVLVEQLASRACSRSSAAPTPSGSASTSRSGPCSSRACASSTAEDGGALRARLPPDRRARREEGLRRHRLRRGPGAGARDREPPARGEGEGREEGRQAQAPEHNFASWDFQTLKRLMARPRSA